MQLTGNAPAVEQPNKYKKHTHHQATIAHAKSKHPRDKPVATLSAHVQNQQTHK
jgi:hypothetical protein